MIRMDRSVVIAVSDLMFQSRIAAAAAGAGLATRVADSPASWDQAMRGDTVLVVVDLQDRALDPLSVIARARAGRARVLAFGRHTEAATLRAARAAGADTVVARSQLVEELPQLIEALIGAGSRGGGAGL
jgi:DNA-binding NarL/FixJ family response regulator